MQLQEVSKFCEFTVKILVHRIETLLQLLFGQFTDGIVCGIVVDIR